MLRPRNSECHFNLQGPRYAEHQKINYGTLVRRAMQLCRSLSPPPRAPPYPYSGMIPEANTHEVKMATAVRESRRGEGLPKSGISTYPEHAKDVKVQVQNKLTSWFFLYKLCLLARPFPSQPPRSIHKNRFPIDLAFHCPHKSLNSSPPRRRLHMPSLFIHVYACATCQTCMNSSFSTLRNLCFCVSASACSFSRIRVYAYV
jgi:hypothetical protein